MLSAFENDAAYLSSARVLPLNSGADTVKVKC